MANTYSQIYIHVVFAVGARQCLIRPDFKDELQKYMTGIVTNNSQKLIAINNMPDRMALPFGVNEVTSCGGGSVGLGCEARLGQELEYLGTPFVRARFAATRSMAHADRDLVGEKQFAPRRIGGTDRVR